MEKEFEARTMLTEDQYSAIDKEFIGIKAIKQINNYYETDDFELRKHGMVLRVRSKNQLAYEATLKIKCNDGDEEYTNKLTSLPDNFNVLDIIPVEAKEKIISTISDVSKIHYITGIKSVRKEKIIDTYLLVLDHNFIGDTEDYDLEVESNSIQNSNEFLDYYCKKYHITRSTNYISKSGRAFNLLKK